MEIWASHVTKFAVKLGSGTGTLIRLGITMFCFNIVITYVLFPQDVAPDPMTLRHTPAGSIRPYSSLDQAEHPL